MMTRDGTTYYVEIEIETEDDFRNALNVIKSRKQIIRLFEDVPSFEVPRIYIWDDEVVIRVLLALYPAHSDLLRKHPISSSMSIGPIIYIVMSNDLTIDEKKMLFDAIVEHKICDPVFLRYIPQYGIADHAQHLCDHAQHLCDHAQHLCDHAQHLCDHCFEKGYLNGLNEGLYELMFCRRNNIDVGAFMKAGADPTFIRYYSSTIDHAFGHKRYDAIQLFVKHGFDISKHLDRISMIDSWKYGFLPSSTKMIGDVLYSIDSVNHKATAIQLRYEGLVTTELTVDAYTHITHGEPYFVFSRSDGTRFEKPIFMKSFY